MGSSLQVKRQECVGGKQDLSVAVNSAAVKNCPCYSAVLHPRTHVRLLGKSSAEITLPSSLLMQKKGFLYLQTELHEPYIPRL